MKLLDPKYFIKLLFHWLRFLTLPSKFLKGVSCIRMCRNVINVFWRKWEVFNLSQKICTD